MSYYSAGGFATAEDLQNQAAMDPNHSRAARAKVELKLSCADLVNKDSMLSKSDPMCVVYERSSGQQVWREVGRTEMIKDNLNPAWKQVVVVEFRFEERQHLKFEVWDVDKEAKDKKAGTTEVKKKDLLGSLETSLGHIVYASSASGVFEANLENVPKGGGKKVSKIKVAVQTLPANEKTISVKFEAKGLTNKDFLGKSDPFLVVFACNNSSAAANAESWANVGQTEVIKNNLNPNWKALDIQLCRLVNDDGSNKKLRLEVYDWDSDKKRTLIGACNTDLKQLRVAKAEKTELALVNDNKKKPDTKGSGKLTVRSLHESDPLSFLSSLRSGVALNFAVAIDFTASNGDPAKPDSLHFLGNGKENQYTSAIRAIGEVMEDYDADRQYPGMGFGAILLREDPKEARHDFSLSEDSLYCRGIHGLVDAYKVCLSRVKLSGPTMFAPVISRVAEMASSSASRAGVGGRIPYQVLLILTDGAITDLDATKRAIVNASNLPMSIVIIGVGNEDFSGMAELDADDGKGLKDGTGNAVKRDIVQFVELRKFAVKDSKGPPSFNNVALAREVLQELPEQISAWLEMKKN